MNISTITDEIKQFDPTIIEKRLRQNELEKILLKYDMKLYMSNLKKEINETATEVPTE
jgi:hypothetical protein